MLSFRVARHVLFSPEFLSRLDDQIGFLEKIHEIYNNGYCPEKYQEEFAYCKRKREQVYRMRAKYPDGNPKVTRLTKVPQETPEEYI